MKLTTELKKIILVNIIMYLAIIPVYTQSNVNSRNSGETELLIPKAASKITIDGKADETCWQQARALTFESFYDDQKPGDRQATRFRMLWDDENVYVFFECEDKYITAREKTRDGQPYFDDCAEVFLMPTAEKINMHFGFELNLYKTVNDFVFLNGIYKNENLVVKSYSPDLDVACTINGTVNDNSDIDKGWTLEMAIPLNSFHLVGPVQPIGEGVTWSMMAVRQDRNDADGNRVTTSTLFPLQGENKNVHEPENFNLIKFIKE